jgi:hypothetical protein
MEALMQHFGSLIWDVSPAVASALLAAIWQGAVVAACVALGLRMIPRLSAAGRSVIWLNVFVLLVLLHGLPVILGHGVAAGVGQDAPVHLNPIHIKSGWSVGLVGLWAALSLWKLAELLVSAIQLRGIGRRAVAVDGGAAGEELLTAGRRTVLCTSDEVERPCVLGFWRPRILIPPALLRELSPLELKLVVEHEMEHLRRGDDWSNLVQKIGLVLFPLNPVLVWVERRLCAERELACDDRVLNSNGGAKAYAICLTHLAEYSLLYRKLLLVLGAWERRSELVRRVHRILRRPLRPMAGRTAAAAMVGVVAAAMACAMLLAQSPQLVSFTPVVSHELEAQVMRAPILKLNPSELNTSVIGARAQLVKAVMPVTPTTDAPKRVRKAVIRRPQTMPEMQIAPERRDLMVLTEWRDVEGTPQVVIAVDRKTRSQYAAVQMAGGWVLFQI